MRRVKKTLPPLLLLASAALWAAGAPDAAPAVGIEHESWHRVLERHGRGGGLDYAGLAADRGDLDRFLADLAGARPAAWPAGERLAFWINAYNAVVAHFVLERYPGLESVRDVDGFFDELTHPVAGERLTLDEIETRGRDLGDPRIHFAVVCASESCPDLRPEPFEAARLDRQLEEQTRAFLGQPDKGLRYDADRNELWLSSIFKWYAGDFTGGSTVVAFFARGKVLGWVLEHLPAELRSALEAKPPSVRYLDYDWGLNDRPAG